MNENPVIVIGPPRSGTTMTASVLQNWLGVIMDGAPMRPNKIINPYGWYEDARLVQANNLLALGSIKLNAWTRRFKRFIRAMQKLNVPWGFKDPRIIPVFGYALTFFTAPVIIRCHRPKEMVVKSQVEKLKWEEDYAIKRYDNSEGLLDRQLKDRVHYRIDFKDYISEKRIIDFFNNTEIIRT
jgi:hypothetical protein